MGLFGRKKNKNKNKNKNNGVGDVGVGDCEIIADLDIKETTASSPNSNKSKSKSKSSNSNSNKNKAFKTSSKSSNKSGPVSMSKQVDDCQEQEQEQDDYSHEPQLPTATAEVKNFIAANRHVPTTTIDDLGQHVQQTKVTKLTDEECEELGIVPLKNKNNKNSSKNSSKKSSKNSSKKPKSLPSLLHSSHSDSHSHSESDLLPPHEQPQHQHRHHELTKSSLVRSVESESESESHSYMDEMTVDPQSDYFDLMDPEVLPLKREKYVPPPECAPVIQEAAIIIEETATSATPVIDNKDNIDNYHCQNDDDRDAIPDGNNLSTFLINNNNSNNKELPTLPVKTFRSDATSFPNNNNNNKSNNANRNLTMDIDEQAILTIVEQALPAATATTTVEIEDLNETTRDLVKTFIGEIWNRGEIDSIEKVCSPRLRFNGHTGLERVGHGGFSIMVQTVRSSLEGYHCEIHSMVVEERKCFCRLKFTGKHVGELMGYPATNRTVSWMGASEFTVCPKRNQILKVWELGDIKTLEAQLH